jgi:hypothetical protein
MLLGAEPFFGFGNHTDVRLFAKQLHQMVPELCIVIEDCNSDLLYVHGYNLNGNYRQKL